MEWSTSALRRLFSKQIQILRARNCPASIIRDFENQRTSVILEASRMGIPSKNIPFLPVILPNLPITMWSICSIMTLVQYRGEAGRCHLSPQRLINTVEVPRKCYFIFDVEDGRVTLGQSPGAAEVFIGEQNRSCLTAAETIALGILTDVLSRHHLDATGSRYNSLEQVPYLAGGGPVVLNWRLVNEAFAEWGSPSCQNRLCFLEDFSLQTIHLAK